MEGTDSKVCRALPNTYVGSQNGFDHSFKAYGLLNKRLSFFKSPGVCRLTPEYGESQIIEVKPVRCSAQKDAQSLVYVNHINFEPIH